MPCPTRIRGLGVIVLMAVACLGNETIASSVLNITEDAFAYIDRLIMGD